MNERRPGETRQRPDERARGRGLLGCVLILLAGLVGPEGPTWSARPGQPGDGASSAARPLAEPVADALAPLGPVKTMISSALWVALLDEVKQGGSEATVSLAEALLAVHPDVDTVRLHLAQHLIVNEAGRAPDDATYRALVLRGLEMLEEGAASGRLRLRGNLGRLLVERSMSDARFTPVASQYFGEDPLEIAIEELRASTAVDDPSPLDVIILADLLVTRGADALDVYADTFRAERDLLEAESLLERLHTESAAMLQSRLQTLREAWSEAVGDGAEEDRS